MDGKLFLSGKMDFGVECGRDVEIFQHGGTQVGEWLHRKLLGRDHHRLYASLLHTSTIALLLDGIRIMWNRKLQQFYISSTILDPGIFSILPLSWHLFWRTRQNSINGRLNKLTNFHLHLLISFIKYFLLVLVTCRWVRDAYFCYIKNILPKYSCSKLYFNVIGSASIPWREEIIMVDWVLIMHTSVGVSTASLRLYLLGHFKNLTVLQFYFNLFSF